MDALDPMPGRAEADGTIAEGGPGARLGRYTLGAELGRGGSSVVRRAEADGTTYALKLLHGNRGGDAGRTFRREAAAIARLGHPSLVSIVELGEHDGQPYLVMELVEGRSLKSLLADGPLDTEQVLRVARGLAAGLVEVHRHGLVHRDIKPSNVIVRPDGEPCLIDFGLAADTDDQKVVGTLRYAPPEQLGLIPAAVGPASDLYSLGVTLYQAVAGAPPVPDGDDFMHRLMAAPAPSLSDVAPAARPALALIVDRLLLKEPDDRYRSASGLLADLDRIDALDEALRAGASPPLFAERRSSLSEPTLIGCEDELAALQRGWERARDGELVVATIRGAGGLGKTRLAQELLREATGAIVLRCKCQDLDRTPFGPIRETADALAAHLDREEDATLAARLRAAAGDHLALLGRLSPTLASALGGATDGGDHAEPARFYATVGAVLAALGSSDTPAIWLIDDLQWLDDASAQILAAMADEAPRHLLVVLTSRPTQRDAPLAGAEALAPFNLPPIELQPLRRADIDAFVTARLGGRPLSPPIVDRLAAATQGNPFALDEYVRALLDSGQLAMTPDGWVMETADLVDLELPEDVLDVVLRRVRALDADTLRVLRVAAVWGGEVSTEDLRRVTQLPEATVHGAVQLAIDRGLVLRRPGDLITLQHDRIREAVVGELAPHARASVHQAIADVLPPSPTNARDAYALAHHLGAGHVERDPAGVAKASLVAGLLALDDHAYEQAWATLSTARDLSGDADFSTERRCAMLTGLGRAGAMTGRLNAAYAALDQALDLTTDTRERFELHYLRTLTYASQGRNDDALSELRRSFDVHGTPYPRSRVLQGISLLWFAVAGLVLFWTGLGRGSAEGEERRRRTVLSRLHYAGTMLAMFDGDTFLMVQFIVRDFFNVQRLPASPEKAIATSVYGAVMGTLQLGGVMKARTRDGIAMAEQIGDRGAVAVCKAYEACGHKWAGDVDRGTQLQLEALPLLCRDLPGSWHTAMMICEQAYSYHHAGRSASAHAHITEYLPHLRRTNNRMFVYNTLAVDYAARTVLGDYAGAADLWAELEPDYDDLKGTGYVQLARVQASFERFVDEANTGPEVESMIAAFAPTLGEDYYSIYAWMLYGYARLDRVLESGGAEGRPELTRTIWNTRVRALTPIFACHPLIWRAALARLDGKRARAQRLLRKAERLVSRVHTPRGSFYVALEQARLGVLSGDRTAGSHARRAAEIAEREQWFAKARAVRAEFPDAFPAGDGSNTLSGSSTETGSTPGRSARYSDALLKVSLASATLNPEAQAAQVLNAVVRVFGAERALFYLLDEDGAPVLQAKAGSGAERVSTTVVNRVIAGCAPVVFTGDEAAELLEAESIQAQGLRSIMAAPLRSRDRTVGVVYLDNRLARGVFTTNDVELLLGLANHIAIAVETARSARLESERSAMERDLELVGAVQTMLLPPRAALQTARLDVVGVYEPAAQSGGDWWWLDQHDDGGVTLWLGDVVGHGAAPAMVTSTVAGAFHSMRALQPDAPPEAVLAHLHQRVAGLGGGFHMSMTALRWDDRLRLWSAGGHPVLVQIDEGVEALGTAGHLLGQDDADWQIGVVERPAEGVARVVLCTDGLTELENEQGRQFGLRRAARELERIATGGAPGTAEALMDALTTFRGARPLDDDLTFLVAVAR